ncbi:MAG TPA: LuxR C-terminal-related transcriptional regulator, partial [Trebonia sp.]
AALADLLPGHLPTAPDRLRFNTDVLALLTRDPPVLCLVDDAHAIDASSLDAIGFSARRLAGRGTTMIIATCDPSGFLGVPRKRLSKLDDGAARDVITGLRPDLVEPLVSAIVEAAGGNPLALAELAENAGDNSDILPRLPYDGALARAYRERLERLPAGARWLLLLAAADEDLDAAGLVRAAETSDVDISELEPAERCGLMRVRGNRLVFPLPLARCVVYDSATLARRRDAHALLAKVFDRPPWSRGLRRAWHLAAAAHKPDPELARELELAASSGAPSSARASAALERAAQLTVEPAAAASRMIAAARYAWLSGRSGRALSLLSGARAWADPDAEGRGQVLAGEIELRSGAASSTLDKLVAAADRFAYSDRKLAVNALMRAAEAVCFSGDYTRFAEISGRASTLRREDDPPGVELVFETIAGFGAAFRADHATAIPALRRVIALAWQAGDAASLTASAACGLLLGDDYTAHRAASQGVYDARARGELALLPLALEMMACSEYWLGRFEAAEATSWEGVRTAWSSGQDNYAGDHLAMLAVLAALRGETEVCLRRLHGLAVPPGAGKLNRPKAFSLWALAVLDLLAGRPEDALERLLSIADPLTGKGHVVVQTMAIPWLVEAAIAAGEGERVRQAVRLFHHWASSTGDPTRCALSARCHALLAPRGGDEAERHFTTALRLHAASESEFERARTQFLYGHRLRRERRPRDAREQLHAAVETFERLGFAAWVSRARAELRAAGGNLAVAGAGGNGHVAAAGVSGNGKGHATGAGGGRGTTAGDGVEPEAETCDGGGSVAPEALTAQQWRIACLAAEGATNREIATRMFLSPRTVDHHMRNIFTRLGIRSRVELARLVATQPLDELVN